MSVPRITKLRTADRIAQMEVQRVVDLCLEGCRINQLLDIGTGSGLFAEAFAARRIEVVGLDADPEMTAAARKAVPGVQYCVGGAEALPFADQSFDALFMGMVLHEIADPLAALFESRRVASKQLTVLEWPQPGPNDPPPPARRLARREIAEMSHSAGFKTSRIRELRELMFYQFI